jgi:uncharacterized protein
MEFHGMETSVVEVLRAQELQRLRRIRQLGLSHFVYPSAEHSRLVHCIGASHLAIRFTKQISEAARGFLVPDLTPGPSAVRDVALAALCHDLGHGPLSHVWETEVIGGEKFDRKAWCASLGLSCEEHLQRLSWHELVGQALLAWPDGQLNKLLEQQEEGTSARVGRLLAGEYYLPYLPRLLSSDVDFDRCDFVIRDGQQAGVAYGAYDLEWLISTVTVGTVGTTNRFLVSGFDRRKAPRVVEQFLVARRAMYDTVYYHKTVRSAEGMMGLLLRRMKQVVKEKGWIWGETSLFDAYKKVVEGGALGPSDILKLDDYSLWVLIVHLSTRPELDVTLADLAGRIISRDLFKMVPCQQIELEGFLRKQDAQERLQNAVSHFCPGDKSYYVHIDSAVIDMLSEKPDESAYFVDIESIDRPATPIREHKQLKPHWEEPHEIVRLYVPREAVEAVLKAVRG